jgi:site-specific recombinase XerC
LDRFQIDMWTRALNDERKSAYTIRTYLSGVRQFTNYCDAQDLPSYLDRETVGAFLSSMMHQGARPATVRGRLLALRNLSAWRFRTGAVGQDPLFSAPTPPVVDRSARAVTDGQLGALLSTCAGGALNDLRDESIVYLMCTTGVRVRQVVDMKVSDVSLTRREARFQPDGPNVHTVAIDAHTVAVLRRYKALRTQHRLASASALWLGDHGRTYSLNALYKSLGRRAQQAGVVDFHPRMLFQRGLIDLWSADRERPTPFAARKP